MRFLRTASTRRLLGVLAGLVAVIGATTAIAVAASGSGPVPKRQPLANAVHQALGAKAVKGISADITFTNHLIDTSALQGSDPVLSGASGRLWLSSSNHQLRLELQSNNGDAEVLVNRRHFWISDPAANTVYQGTLPSDLMGSGTGSTSSSGSKSSSDGNGSKGGQGGQGAADHGIPSVAKIQAELTKLMTHVNLSGARPGDVGGQPAYTVSVSPKHDGGLLGSVALAWDAVRGVPLRFAIYAKGNPDPVIELTADNISYGAVPASVFAISHPRGAKVVTIGSAQDASAGSQSTSAHGGKAAKGGKGGRAAARHHHLVTGLDAVKAKLHFPLTAPDSLVGLPRRTVSLLSYGGSPAALVTYGQGLGGIAVIERAHHGGAAAKPAGPGSGNGQGNLSLPTVSINGATGQELDTALGTLVTFSRGGVDYTVVGSVPSAAADAAARAL